MNWITGLDTPIGRLYLQANESGLCAVRTDPLALPWEERSNAVLEAAKLQLTQYFAGDRDTFDLALCAEGTAFERAVWRQLQEIPFGETRSYGQIAKAIGRERAVRAVGAACGRNPLLIVVPCHRVVGISGRLTGFAAGLEAKRCLLALEGHTVMQDRIIR